MERIFDLPAHPLLVHFPVVAIPVLAIVAVVIVVSRRWRRALGLPSIALGVACVASTWLATQSGEALVDPLFLESVIKDHRSLGNTTLYFVLALFIFLCAFVMVARRADAGDDGGEAAPGRLRSASLVLSAVVVVFAVLSTTWVVRTGHEGARVTWEGQLPPSE